MVSFPADIYTEPSNIDFDTLANLGPLAPLAGVWQGERGLDVKPKAEGPKKQAFVERIELQPIDPQTNGPQLFYGLRYHTHVVKPGQVKTYHDQVGYWLWEPASGTLIQTLTLGMLFRTHVVRVRGPNGMHGLPAPVAQASRQVGQAPVWARTLRGGGWRSARPSPMRGNSNSSRAWAKRTRTSVPTPSWTMRSGPWNTESACARTPTAPGATTRTRCCRFAAAASHSITPIATC